MRFARRPWDIPDLPQPCWLGLLSQVRPSCEAFFLSYPDASFATSRTFWRCAAACDSRFSFNSSRIHPTSPARFRSAKFSTRADLKSRLVAPKCRRKSGAFPEVLSPSVRWPCRAIRCCRHPDDPASAFRIDLRTSPRAGSTREPTRRPCGFSLPSHER